MPTAYKRMKTPNGVVVIFESDLPDIEKISSDLMLKEGQYYLRLGDEHFIRIDDTLLDWLKETKLIHVVVSGTFDYEMEYKGAIEISDIAIGKILAYIEMQTG